jgi:hypothetical protein
MWKRFLKENQKNPLQFFYYTYLVVCSGCSAKSFVIEGIKKKPVRVCDTVFFKVWIMHIIIGFQCYNKLCQGMSTNRPLSTIFPASMSNSSTEAENATPTAVPCVVPIYHGDSSDYSDDDNRDRASDSSATAETVSSEIYHILC